MIFFKPARSDVILIVEEAKLSAMVLNRHEILSGDTANETAMHMELSATDTRKT
jgi:hypothetical protein